MSESDGKDVVNIEKLGGGWGGEEALAISVYCCLKYSDNIKDALISSVNHSGDSDSTGAITGNILGAYLGVDAVPDDWLERLEMKETMQGLIDRFMEIIEQRF